MGKPLALLALLANVFERIKKPMTLSLGECMQSTKVNIML